MPGLLDGQIAAAIYAGFKGKLQKGTLWRATVAESGGLDDRGDPLTVDPTTWDMQGFTDNYSDAFKTREGLPEGAVKVCIFGKSLANGTVRPLKDDKALLNGQWWQLRKADTDPAAALWVCPGIACAAPTAP